MRHLARMIMVATLLYSANFFADAEVKAAPYFKCATGYTFDINNAKSGAHCRKKVSAKVKPISCPNVKFMGKRIGTFPKTKSGKDICRGTVKIAGVTQTTDHDPLKCPTGYSYKKNHQGNKDRCVKPGGWIYKAPTVQFNSN